METATPPMFVAVECRLTSAEAEALAKLLPTLRTMVQRHVVTCIAEMREPALSGLDKLCGRLAEQQPPFE